MKTHYVVMIFAFIINLFMALSLNSFSSSSVYLPVMFLYFLSNLASFLDKITYYKDAKLHCERRLSLLCFCLCFFVVCLYIANSIGCIEIMFQNNHGIYKILVQGTQASFFTFNSIDITLFIFCLAFVMPFSYLLLCIIPYLRELGYTKDLIIKISRDHFIVLIILIVISIIFGMFGIFVCYLKYYKSFCAFGSPQYYKYFWAFSLISLVFSYGSFLHYYKNKKSTKNTD